MSNLPAGFQITSIDGLRCTAVPRSLTTLTGSLASEAAAFTTSSSASTTTSESAATSISNPQIQGSPPDVASAAAAAGAVSTPSTAPTAVPAIATSSTSTSPIVTSTSAVVFISTSSTEGTASFSTSTSSSAIHVSKETTPTTSSSTAPAAVAQSEVSASPTTLILGNNINGSGSITPTVTSVSPDPVGTNASSEASSATAGILTTPRAKIGPVVGGVVGSVAFLGLIGLFIFFFRRKRRVRESLLTPLTTGRRSSFYDSDALSVGPTGRGRRWKSNIGYQTDRIRNLGTGIKTGLVGIGASVKSKVAGDRSKTPSVDLNRGNSQFLDGPIPQHSRNNSILSSNGEKISLKERAADFFDRIKESAVFNMRFGKKADEPADPFAAARGMTEKQANATSQPNFSQLLGMDDRDLQLRTERRRASLTNNTNSLPQLGSLGLDFSSIEDPFADPKGAAVTATKSQPWKPTNPTANPFADPVPRTNPFADPVTRPGPSIPKANTYIADIRRSRGQSIDGTKPTGPSGYRPPSTTVNSRYPSSIAQSRDSYRDTVFSSFSANVRKGKGRSDPFDLERPELWRSPGNSLASNDYPNPLNTSNTNMPPMSSIKGNKYGGPGNKDSRIMSTASYASKYSSGVSSLGGDWGDPGPDLGPGSSNSSMRGNVGSTGGSGDFSKEGIPGFSDRGANDNTNSLNRADSKGSVGKAM